MIKFNLVKKGVLKYLIISVNRLGGLSKNRTWFVNADLVLHEFYSNTNDEILGS